MNKYYIFLLTCPITLFLDQWSKKKIISAFYLGQSISIIKDFFNITFVQNRGAAFGFLNNAPASIRDPFFLIIPVIAAFIFIFLFLKLPKKALFLASIYSLIFSGAVGNFIDRLKYGYVIDFLDFHWKEVYHWPAFNVADSCIVVGATLWIIHSYLIEKKSTKNPLK